LRKLGQTCRINATSARRPSAHAPGQRLRVFGRNTNWNQVAISTPIGIEWNKDIFGIDVKWTSTKQFAEQLDAYPIPTSYVRLKPSSFEHTSVGMRLQREIALIV
jgi:hypothetical protein